MKYYGKIADPKDPITKEFLESYVAAIIGGGAAAGAGVYAGVFSTNGIAQYFDISHNLNSKDILYAFFDDITDDFVFFQNTKPVDGNTLRVNGAEIPAGLTFRVIVVAKSAVVNGGGGGGGGGSVISDHSQLTNLDVADQHPLSAIQGLVAALASINSAISGAAMAASLGAVASVADAPHNGKPHVRQDGGWVEAGSGGGAIVGEIRLLPFRATALPFGWYFCNGDKFSNTTLQGAALNSLPATLKDDWGILPSSGEISLPNLLDSYEGGYFLRSVDNVNRIPGHKQSDAIRNIKGSLVQAPDIGSIWSNSPVGSTALTGAFKTTVPAKSKSFNVTPHGANTVTDLYFDASGSVPIATENRPINVGMTPAIYLGV